MIDYTPLAKNKVCKNGKNWIACGEDCFMPMDELVGGPEVRSTEANKVGVFYYPNDKRITFTGQRTYADHTRVDFHCASFTEAERLIKRIIKASEC